MLNLNLNLNNTPIFGGGGAPAPVCPASLISTTDIMGYYKFDDDYINSLGESFFGTAGPNNMNPFASGKFGSAASFNGVNSWLAAFGNSNEMEPVGTGGWTLSTWVSLDDTTNNQSLWDKRNPGSSGMRVLIRPGAIRDILVTWNTQNQSFSLPAGVFTDDTWHHVVVRQNAGTNTFKVVVDDVSLGTATRTSYTASGQLLNVGRDRANTSSYLNGRLDEYTIWDRELTNAEITTLYEAVCPLTTQVTVSDADAQAFIDIANIYDTTQANAINDAVVSLKAEGLWSKLYAFYPFAGLFPTQQRFNLKDPRDLDAAFRLDFGGAGTFDRLGYQPAGVNGSYADTHFSTNDLTDLNDIYVAHYQSFYQAGALSGDNWGDGGTYRQALWGDVQNGTNFFGENGGGTNFLGTFGNEVIGNWTFNKETAGDSYEWAINGNVFSSGTATLSAGQNDSFLLGAYNNGGGTPFGGSNANFLTFVIAESLSSSEQAAMQTILDDYNYTRGWFGPIDLVQSNFAYFTTADYGIRTSSNQVYPIDLVAGVEGSVEVTGSGGSSSVVKYETNTPRWELNTPDAATEVSYLSTNYSPPAFAIDDLRGAFAIVRRRTNGESYSYFNSNDGTGRYQFFNNLSNQNQYMRSYGSANVQLQWASVPNTSDYFIMNYEYRGNIATSNYLDINRSQVDTNVSSHSTTNQGEFLIGRADLGSSTATNNFDIVAFGFCENNYLTAAESDELIQWYVRSYYLPGQTWF